MTGKVEYLERYSVAPSPSRDYHGLKILRDEVPAINSWDSRSRVLCNLSFVVLPFLSPSLSIPPLDLVRRWYSTSGGYRTDRTRRRSFVGANFLSSIGTRHYRTKLVEFSVRLGLRYIGRIVLYLKYILEYTSPRLSLYLYLYLLYPSAFFSFFIIFFFSFFFIFWFFFFSYFFSLFFFFFIETGDHLVDYVKLIARGKGNSLLTLPRSSIERIIGYLKLEDIVNLTSLSRTANVVSYRDARLMTSN